MTPIVAHVRRVLIGHSERALIHAVDDEGHEYKIEVPTTAVHDASGDQVLLITWSLQAAPGSDETVNHPARATMVAAAAPTPDEVDQEFMALMSRGRREASTDTTTTIKEVPASMDMVHTHSLAVLLGMRPARPG